MYSATSWKDFAVLDTGDGEKLERWGDIILRRPDPQTIWPKRNPALWERDRDYGGFRWLDADRCGDNTYIFERYDLKGNRVVCVFNFSPNEYRSYGIPAEKGAYTEIFNTDKPCYGGSGCDNPTRLTAKKAENGGFFLKINVPAFGACFFRYTKPRTSNKKQEGIKGHD